MKRYGAVYSSLVICLFLLFCASCQPFLSRVSSQTCSEVSSDHAIVSLSNPTPDGWARYSPAGLNLSIALPGEPRPTPISKSESAQRNGWKITAYSYTDKQVFAFLVCNTSSDGWATTKILKELTDGFLNGYKNRTRTRTRNSRPRPPALAESQSRGATNSTTGKWRWKGSLRRRALTYGSSFSLTRGATPKVKHS